MKLRNKKTGEVVDVDFGKIYESVKTTRIACNIYWNKWHKEKHGFAPDCPKPSLKPEDVLEKFGYDTLAELNEEWEDYEEPKGCWMINSLGEIICPYDAGLVPKGSKEIGNYFEAREESEKAVEKLKAWKRLKDKGFSFEGYDDGYKHDFNSGHIEFYIKNDGDVLNDLDLLFGGGE